MSKPNANHHEKMASALRVIRTWAAFDLEHPAGPLTLNPAHVLKLCDDALSANASKRGE